MNAKRETIKGIYYGIEVEILTHWSHCSLVRCQGREFVVETADLTVMHSLAKGPEESKESGCEVPSWEGQVPEALGWVVNRKRRPPRRFATTVVPRRPSREGIFGQNRRKKSCW